MSRKRPRRMALGKTSELNDYWMSYSDLMAGLLLIFILFLTVTILDYKGVEEVLAEKTDTLKQKEKQIQSVLGVKAEIIKELQLAFKDSNLSMDIDPNTGSIRFEGGVFFESASDSISEDGRKNLEEFVPKYISILLSPQFKDSVSQIIVEGHTDKKGSYLFNLDLSQRRAHSVVKKIFEEDFKKFPFKEDLKSFITANGRAYSKPIVVNGVYNPDKSRRVEFLFRLKDDELMNQVLKLVDQE
jgi:outer membrane protein OmpA-like peptidoglycan-associated protein